MKLVHPLQRCSLTFSESLEICYLRTGFLFLMIDTERYFSVLDRTTATGWDPKDVAQSVFRAVSVKSKDVVLAGPAPKVAIYLRTLCPALFFSIMSSRARKELSSTRKNK